MVCRIAVLLGIAYSAYAQTAITGTFKAPNGTAVTGRVIIVLASGVRSNSCSTHPLVLPYRQVVVNITSGTLGAVSLFATSCLSPAKPYSVTVMDSTGKTLYRGTWTVPNQPTADVTVL